MQRFKETLLYNYYKNKYYEKPKTNRTLFSPIHIR